jgi:hypothetical protein
VLLIARRGGLDCTKSGNLLSRHCESGSVSLGDDSDMQKEMVQKQEELTFA